MLHSRDERPNLAGHGQIKNEDIKQDDAVTVVGNSSTIFFITIFFYGRLTMRQNGTGIQNQSAFLISQNERDIVCHTTK